MKSTVLILAAISAPVLCSAWYGSDEVTAVLSAAQAQQTQETVIFNQSATVVFVGNDAAGCSAVGVMYPHNRIENYRVCNGQAELQPGPPPAWVAQPDSEETLRSVVQNAVMYGKASQLDPNGYLISATSLRGIGLCQNIEVLITYQGNLVDRDLKPLCGAQNGVQK